MTVKGKPRAEADSRTRMVQSAAARIGRLGVTATSFSDIVADSGAPRGSIYHHFPEGKRELTDEAVRWVGDQVALHQRACTATTAAGVLAHFVALFRHVAESSRGAAGCAVAGVAVDSSAGEVEQLRVVRAVFRSWVTLLAQQLEAAGLASMRARSVATMAVAAIEGALILCRSEGGSGPIEAVGDELGRLVGPDRAPARTAPGHDAGRSSRRKKK